MLYFIILEDSTVHKRILMFMVCGFVTAPRHDNRHNMKKHIIVKPTRSSLHPQSKTKKFLLNQHYIKCFK